MAGFTPVNRLAPIRKAQLPQWEQVIVQLSNMRDHHATWGFSGTLDQPSGAGDAFSKEMANVPPEKLEEQDIEKANKFLGKDGHITHESAGQYKAVLEDALLLGQMRKFAAEHSGEMIGGNPGSLTIPLQRVIEKLNERMQTLHDDEQFPKPLMEIADRAYNRATTADLSLFVPGVQQQHWTR